MGRFGLDVLLSTPKIDDAEAGRFEGSLRGRYCEWAGLLEYVSGED